MALADSRPQRMSMLCAMYFAQGVPWGFMVTALAAYLADRGVSDATLGELTAVVLLPWTFKLVWGPLIDTMTIRSMGRRRPWIIGAELMMAVSLLGILMLGDLTDNLRLLGWMFFIHNCFASLQDVATDALAVDILPPKEQGKMNGFMWGSKLIGKAIGAAVMALVISMWGLPAAVMLQFAILVVIMLFPVLMLERAGEKRFPWSRGAAVAAEQIAWGDAPAMSEPAIGGSADDLSAASRSAAEDASNPYKPPATTDIEPEEATPAVSEDVTTSLRNPVHVIKDLFQAFSLLTTAGLFVYGVTHVIGWGIVEVVTKPLYTQQLGWSFDQVSYISGAAVFTEMFGALVGGFLADRFGRRKVMVTGFGLYGLMAAVFAMSPGLWGQTWFAAGYLFVNPGALAMGSVGFLSMAMRISWTKAAATMFTIYMTVSNVGHVLGNKWVGTLREGWELSYEQTFWVAALAMWLPLLLLPVIRPERVDAMRNRELGSS